MAAVAAVMDESYADRAKKATLAPNNRNNIKVSPPKMVHDAPGVVSSSTSETLASSPALSASQAMTTSLPLPPSVPLSSASSEQASPSRLSLPLPSRNAWTERSARKSPQKVSPSADITIPQSDQLQVMSNSQPQPPRRDPTSPYAPSAKAIQRSNPKDNDPFVVKYNLNPPSLSDAQSWPQVGEPSHPVSPNHRTRPSGSSASSATMVSGPLTPAKPSNEQDSDQTPSKKSKGEKTKWVPFPAKELQDAADAAARNSGSSSKSHSPHTNGGKRLSDEPTSNKRTTRASSRSEKSSPVTTGNTRHDRNSSLNVPSSTSSRRVSPLHLTTNLPPQSTGIDQPPISGSPSYPQDPSSSNSQLSGLYNKNPTNEITPITNKTGHPSTSRVNPSSHSRNSSQNFAPGPPMVYPPMWAPPVYAMPYYPPYPGYHQVIPPVSSTTYSTQQGDRPQPPRKVREKRKRRPKPEDAPPLAGYRTTTAATLSGEDEDPIAAKLQFWSAGDETDAEEPSVTQTGSQPAGLRVRDPWWSSGVPANVTERWLSRHLDLIKSEFSAEELSSGQTIQFGIDDGEASFTAKDSPVESAILQHSSNVDQTAQPGTTYPTTWQTPGTGPSALDIGLAMGMPVAAPPMHMPPPVYMGVSPHLSSPASMSSRNDWAARDDPFTVMPQVHNIQYPQYSYPPPAGQVPGYDSNIAPRASYHSNDGSTRGTGRYRDDRFYNSRGRGRGFYPSRGRGFRGSRGYSPHVGSPGAIGHHHHHHPPASPIQPPPNPITVYIPDPIHHPMYPYSSPAPPLTNGYHSPLTPSKTESTSGPLGRPPSPKPLTHIGFPLDNIRYKLLGQIEYYLSPDNVAGDLYLREKMDTKGWVSLQTIQSFRRIQSLNVGDDVIRETLNLSQHVEVRHNHVRMINDAWKPFVLSNAAESTVPDTVEPNWYQQPYYPAYGGYPPPYPYNPYSYYTQPPQQASGQTLTNGIADYILRRPEEKPNGLPESGTSAGESFDSTSRVAEGEEAETSEDDVVFVIGEPQPMSRSVITPSSQTTFPEAVPK